MHFILRYSVIGSLFVSVNKYSEFALIWLASFVPSRYYFLLLVLLVAFTKSITYMDSEAYYNFAALRPDHVIRIQLVRSVTNHNKHFIWVVLFHALDHFL